MTSATYNPDTKTYTVTLSRAEAHVHIWGGPTARVARVEEALRQALVAEEDAAMTDDEYRDVLAELEAL